MITEDYVSFETAKLLKEKGFDEKCRALYTLWLDEVEGPKEDEAENWNIEPKYFSAPTLQMVMKWLREVHKTEIRVIYDNDKLCWYGACNPMSESQILLGSGRKSKSYEEACESAIKYCLENLI